MLIFISDLHLSDTTAGSHFLPPRAFDGAFERLARHARSASSSEIILVYLGDVFDLVRTTGWFDDPDTTPWAAHVDPVKLEEKALMLLERILEGDAHNRETFSILGGSLKERYGFPVEPLRVYIPGNHDRICNEFPRLRARVAEALGLHHNPPEQRPDPEKPFPFSYSNPDYRTFARHGHEWDDLNFENMSGKGSFSDADYLRLPIGEVIAAEIVSRLPYDVDKRLQAQGVPEGVRQRTVRQLEAIEDVRPMTAILPWLLDKAEEIEEQSYDALRVLDESLRDIIADFTRLPFVQAWREKRRTLNPFARANQLAFIFWLLRHLGIKNIYRYLGWLEPLFRSFYEGDNNVGAAIGEFRRFDKLAEPYLYLLYGHTHVAEQVPIGTLSPRKKAQVYLNTGTWRALARQGIRGGFMTWKNLNYTVIYHPERDPGSKAHDASYPTFETWTGSLLEPVAPRAPKAAAEIPVSEGG